MAIDTQSPVLGGSAFTNYDTVFMHGVIAEANMGSLGVFGEGDLADCQYRSGNNPAGVYQPKVYWVDVLNGGILSNKFLLPSPTMDLLQLKLLTLVAGIPSIVE